MWLLPQLCFRQIREKPITRVRECAVFNRNALNIANAELSSRGCHSFLLSLGPGSPSALQKFGRANA